ncbi:MAG: peptide deformylase [Candidatus Taylorbacteria bacterium]
MQNIIQRNDPILRGIARSITEEEISSAKLSIIIGKMKKALSEQKDGIAIAAPQIGENISLFVVSGSLLKQADKSYTGSDTYLIFINPEIIKMSKRKNDVEEGCLSVRWLYGKVKRSMRVTLSALNEKGEKIERGASGLLAQIFQHEVDHLNGILFIDKAKEVWEMSESEIKELQGK